jgi:hypothetical protein
LLPPGEEKGNEEADLDKEQIEDLENVDTIGFRKLHTSREEPYTELQWE